MSAPLGTKLYSIYVKFLAVLFLVPACLVVFVLPGLRWRWSVGHGAVRTTMACARMKLRVRGSDPGAQVPSLVFVANHASFLDGLILTASFARPVTFIVAGEFEHRFFVGRVLRRIGAAFVRRGNPMQAATDARRIIEELKRGRRVVFFPEGTLDPRVGVRAFHLGAFLTATRAGVPVVPVGIAGSRSVLEPGGKLLHPGNIVVTLGARITVTGRGRLEVIEMCERSRDAVVDLCGEPAIGPSPRRDPEERPV
jgi:1-acyl-sn-glycerol-3-phosphate acyltransferase